MTLLKGSNDVQGVNPSRIIWPKNGVTLDIHVHAGDYTHKVITRIYIYLAVSGYKDPMSD